MLSRAATPLGRMSQQPARGMATAQALRQRISSVKNIQKITSAMKMVAVCKLRVAQENLEKARSFQSSIGQIEFKPKDDAATPKTQLWVGISSDRGLCGAINSSISRGVRDSILKAQAAGLEEAKVLLIGEKCKQGLERQFKNNFTFTLSETAKFKPSTFKQCGELTDYWTSVPTDMTSVFFQKFVSMISYDTTEDKFWSYEAVKDDIAAEFADYEMEGDSDILENLHQFRQCVKLYHYFAENETSTLSARMTAMDNSATNAKEMIDSLNLVLNRNRQAKITTELSEIISGAAAADEQN